MKKDGGLNFYVRNRNNPSDRPGDNDKDGYTNVEGGLHGTEPMEYIDYKKPENNKNTLTVIPS